MRLVSSKAGRCNIGGCSAGSAAAPVVVVDFGLQSTVASSDGNASAASILGALADSVDRTADREHVPLDSPLRFTVVVGQGSSRTRVKFGGATSTEELLKLVKGKRMVSDKTQPLRMAAFKHVPGCEVCKDMYPHYRTPDGQVSARVDAVRWVAPHAAS
jgi:hypothetical protein